MAGTATPGEVVDMGLVSLKDGHVCALLVEQEDGRLRCRLGARQPWRSVSPLQKLVGYVRDNLSSDERRELADYLMGKRDRMITLEMHGRQTQTFERFPRPE